MSATERQRTADLALAAAGIVMKRPVPAAAGASRLARLDGPMIVIETDHPIVAQELRLRAGELLAAFVRAPGGIEAGELRVVIRPGPATEPGPGPRITGPG